MNPFLSTAIRILVFVKFGYQILTDARVTLSGPFLSKRFRSQLFFIVRFAGRGYGLIKVCSSQSPTPVKLE